MMGVLGVEGERLGVGGGGSELAVKLSIRLIGWRCEVRNWVGVDPKGRIRLIGSLSAASPCLTASVIRGTIDSTTDAINWEMSLREGLGCSDGMDCRSSWSSCRNDCTMLWCSAAWMVARLGCDGAGVLRSWLIGLSCFKAFIVSV